MPSDTTPTPDRPAELYFGYADVAPDLGAFDVKRVHPDTLLGRPAAFTIIGESHYVGLPALGFHEICSCAPLSLEATYATPLSRDAEREFRFDGGRLGATTVVAGRNIEAFPGPDEATVAFRFGPDAWTTIHVRDAGYETYHTYPEHGLALHTETELVPHAADAEPSIDDPIRHTR